MSRLINRAGILIVVMLTLSLMAMAQGPGRGPGPGRGGMGPGPGGMMGQGGPNSEDMQTIHALFAAHKQITRSVKNIDQGVETLTESDDSKVQALITSHAWAMKQRLEKRQPIRMWDPLFAALFQHADKIKLEVIPTAKGVKIVETSTDPYVVKLIQSHAGGVSEFVQEGMAVMHKRHELPGEAKAEPEFLGKGDGITTCPVSGEPVNKEIKFGFAGRTVYFCCENCRDAFKKNPEKYLKP